MKVVFSRNGMALGKCAKFALNGYSLYVCNIGYLFVLVTSAIYQTTFYYTLLKEIESADEYYRQFLHSKFLVADCYRF